MNSPIPRDQSATAAAADVASRIEDALEAADASFRVAGDAMEALEWIAFAAKQGRPLPPAMAGWLAAALTAYRNGEAKSLDAAFGLNARGRGSPRRSLHDEHERQRALAKMLLLQEVGATIPEAATLVSKLSPDFKEGTLENLYRKRNMSRLVSGRAIGPSGLNLDDELAKYPDRPIDAKLAKKAIRNRAHSKSRI